MFKTLIMYAVAMNVVILLAGIAYVGVNFMIWLWDEIFRKKIDPESLTERQRGIWLSIKKND